MLVVSFSYSISIDLWATSDSWTDSMVLESILIWYFL